MTNAYSTGFLPYDLATWLFEDNVEVPFIFIISTLLAAYFLISLYLRSSGRAVSSESSVSIFKWFVGTVSISYGILITGCYILFLM